MRYIRLFISFLQVSMVGETAYRINFFIQLFQSLLNMGMSLGGLAIIFSYTNHTHRNKNWQILTNLQAHFSWEG